MEETLSGEGLGDDVRVAVRGGSGGSLRIKSKLDFRFASVDDAEDLAAFVNDAIERERLGENAFRSNNYILPASIETDCSSMCLRWVVLETPVPEEDIVAAAKISISREGSVVQYIGVCKIAQDTPFEDILMGQLLKKIESVVSGHGQRNITVECVQWQEKLMDWLSQQGYEELGGYLSSDESFVRPSMILTYRKSLFSEPLTSAESADAGPKSVHSQETLATDALETMDDEAILVDISDSIPSSMEDLMVDLFRALHNEC